MPFVPLKGAGLLMNKEIEFLGKLLGEVERPYVAVVGGAKVSDKIAVMENLLGRVNAFLIGGAMANTFLKAKGANVGKSRVEEDKLGLARQILAGGQRMAGVQPPDRGQVILRHAEVDEDRLHLVNHHQGGIVLLHQIAGMHQQVAGSAGMGAWISQ